MHEPAETATDSQIKASTEQILSKAWDGDVRLGEPEILREDKCFRFHVKGAPSGAPASVILKKARREEGRPIDPNSAIANPAHRFLDEWACLAFLKEITPDARLAPRLYGGDRTACLIAYEDFGLGSNVGDALLGHDKDAARLALRLHAETTARLHNAGIGREGDYNRIRDALGPRVENREGLGWAHIGDLREEMIAGFGNAGIAANPAFWDDLEAVGQAIERDGPYRSFVHNDTCPDNTWLKDRNLRLIDFERGGYHHRMLDAAFARMSMPHCWLANQVPIDIVNETEQAYRLTSSPLFDDDQEFGPEMVHACFYWLISNGTWLLKSSLEEDFTWGISTWRQRILHRLDALAYACDQFNTMPAVARTARATIARLRQLWPIEAIPVFPAFR